MTAPKPRRYPPGPKFHGAWMGAGTGQLAALLAVQVVQAFTHHPLDPGLTHAIFAGASMGVAALGAYLMPHQDRPARAPLTLSAEEVAAVQKLLASVRVMPMTTGGHVTRVQPSATGTGPVTQPATETGSGP